MTASSPGTATQPTRCHRIANDPDELNAAAPSFVDAFGTSYELDLSHRDRIKPGWQRALSPDGAASDAVVEPGDAPAELLSRIRLGLHMLSVHGCSIRDRDIAVVGCGGWDELICLLGHGAKSVVGIDGSIPESLVGAAKVTEHGGLDCPITQPESFCKILRGLNAWQPSPRAIATLTRDDIRSCDLPGQSIDVVLSWRTLEHLADAESAMRAMLRLLRPGGFAFHEYNPFFCIEGGHALVTLDMSWGHVRLGANDVHRYLETIRPNEAERAGRYFQTCLNRMTIAEFDRICTDVGYLVMCFVPRARTEDVLELTQQILDEARKVHPKITVNDLVCRIVRVVLRKSCAL